jgi:hypothetical protein
MSRSGIRPGQRTRDDPLDPRGVSTQIYEGTNQIQRVVIAKKLLG